MKLLILIGFLATLYVWSTFGAGWGLLTAFLFMGGLGWSLIGALLVALLSPLRTVGSLRIFGSRNPGRRFQSGDKPSQSLGQQPSPEPTLVQHIPLFRDGRGVTVTLFGGPQSQPHRWSWVFDDGLSGYDSWTAELAERAMTKIERELNLPLTWHYRDI